MPSRTEADADLAAGSPLAPPSRAVEAREELRLRREHGRILAGALVLGVGLAMVHTALGQASLTSAEMAGLKASIPSDTLTALLGTPARLANTPVGVALGMYLVSTRVAPIIAGLYLVVLGLRAFGEDRPGPSVARAIGELAAGLRRGPRTSGQASEGTGRGSAAQQADELGKAFSDGSGA